MTIFPAFDKDKHTAPDDTLLTTVARAKYNAYPDDYKGMRDGRHYALYQNADGATVYGPVQLVDAQLATYDVIRQVAEQHQYQYIYWDDDPLRFEPLLIDATTAHVIVRVHDALHPDNRERFRKALASNRPHFSKMLDFAWKAVGG